MDFSGTVWEEDPPITWTPPALLVVWLSTRVHKYDNVLKSLPAPLYEREEKDSPFSKGG
jgi:hypothetical protein